MSAVGGWLRFKGREEEVIGMHQHDHVAGPTSKQGAALLFLRGLYIAKKMFFPKSNKLNRTYSVFIGQGHSQTLSLPLTAQFDV